MSGYAIEATPNATLFTPRSPLPGRPPVVLCHGAGSDRRMFSGAVTGTAGNIGSSRLAAYLAGQGLVCIATDLGGPLTWGKNSVVTAGGDVDQAAAAARTAAAARGITLDSARILLVGVSMGGLVALRYMTKQPAKVAAGVVIIAPLSLTEFYSNNRGGYQSSVATAYGVTAPAALPADADPGTNLAALATAGPLQVHYSTADALMTPSTTQPFVTGLTAAGGDVEALVCDTTQGHSDVSVLNVDRPAILRHLVLP